MTNMVDVLRELKLDNKKLAELRICNCTKSVTNWSEAERKPNVEEGQIREIDSHKWLVGIINENRDTCGMLSEKGVIRYFPTDVVDTWKIVADETEEMFYNKIINNSMEINETWWKSLFHSQWWGWPMMN